MNGGEYLDRRETILPCWRRSNDLPLVVENVPSLTACIPTPVYPLSPTGALSKKAFHKETGEAVRRVLPQRTVRAFVPLSRVVYSCVRVTTTCRVCWKLAERRWLP